MNPQFSHIRLIASDIDGTLLQGGRTEFPNGSLPRCGR